MALALCAVLAAPPGRRAVVAIGGAIYAMAVAYSVILLGWHLPSDAFGGFAIAGCATCLGVAVLRHADRRRAGRAGDLPAVAPLVAAGALAAGLGGALATVKVLAATSDPERQLAFLAGVAGIGALALALAAGLTVVLRTATPPAATAAPRRRWPRGRG
jgi:hypothetical protein